MGFDGISLLLALAVVFLPLLLAWHLLGRGERPSRRPGADDPPGGPASRRHR